MAAHRFDGSKPGPGRPPGLKNRRTRILDEWFDRVVDNITTDEIQHPIDFLVDVYTNTDIEWDNRNYRLRIEAAKEVAKYLCRPRSSDIGVTIEQTDEKIDNLSDSDLDKIMQIAIGQKQNDTSDTIN